MTIAWVHGRIENREGWEKIPKLVTCLVVQLIVPCAYLIFERLITYFLIHSVIFLMLN